MSENINLAALWVPVMAETRQIAGQLREAGVVGRREFMQAFSGGGGSSSGLFGNLGNEMRDQLRTGLRLASAELPGGLNLLTQGLISGFDGVRNRTLLAERAQQEYTRAVDLHTAALGRQAAVQARVNELQAKGLAANSSQMLSAANSLESANRKAARTAEDVAAAEGLKAAALNKSKNSALGFVAATGAIGGFGVAVGVSAKAAGDFQQKMVMLHASAGETADGLNTVSAGILKMAGEVGYSANQLADGMFLVEKAGFHGSEALKVLQAAAEGAKAENADLTEVVGGLTTQLTDFGGNAPEQMSKLVAAAGLARGSFQDFAGAVHSAEPLIAGIGKSQGLTAEQMKHLSADMLGLGAQMTQTGMTSSNAFELIGHAASKLLGPTAAMRSMMGSLGLDAQEVTDHLGERGVAGTLQNLQQALQAHTKDGMVDLDVHYQSAQAARAEAQAFDALPGPAKAVAQQIKDGTLSYKDFRKSRGGLNVELANELGQWNALNSKLTGYSDLIKSGIGDHISYDQALKILTGDQETMKVALQASGENADAMNDKMRKIADASTDASGKVKGFSDVQGEFNFKMDQFKASMGAAAIQLGTAFLPELTAIAGGLASVGSFLDHNKGLTEGLVITVGALGTAYIGLKTALGFKHLIDDIRTSFLGLNTAAATANATMAEAGAAAQAGAVGVEAAAAEEVTAEGSVTAAAGLARTALSFAAPVAAGVAIGLPIAQASLHSDAIRNSMASNPLGDNPVSRFINRWTPDFLGGDIVDSSGNVTPSHAQGGPIFGSGPKGKDSILSWLAPGEHVLTSGDVDAMGGHSAVYGLRNALHRQYGGEVGPDVQAAMGMAGTPYSQGARNDCSGMVGRIVNAAVGMPGGGLPTTQNMAEWLAARGFQPGLGGPGTISVGWYNHGPNPNDGHTAITLSDGENAESGGSHGNFLIGAGAAGASSSQFDQHMYLPAGAMYGEGQAMGGGGAGGGGGFGGGGGMGAGGGIPAGGTPGMGPGGQAGYYMANPQKVGHAEEQLRHIDEEIRIAEERKTNLKADASQVEKDRLNEEIKHLHGQRAEEEGRLAKAEQGDFHAGRGGGGRGGKGEGGELGQGANSAAQQFGSSFVNGLLSDFGFGNVLGGKSPLDWGAVKLAEGIGQYGMGLLKPLMAGGGMGGPGMGAPGLGGLGGGGLGAAPGHPGLSGGDPLGGESPGGNLESGGGNGIGAALAKSAPSAVKSIAQAMGVPGADKLPGMSLWMGGGAKPSGPGAQPLSTDIGDQITRQQFLGAFQKPDPWHFDPSTLPGAGGPSGSPIPIPMTNDVLQQAFKRPPPPTPGDVHQLPGPWNSGGHFATGGPSGTDTVPAWLSPGEFVMKPAAVQKYGANFMTSVNAGKFATGGVVPLAPSSVGSVPTAVSGSGTAVAHHAPVTYDNRTIISGNTLSDPYQLAQPIHEINNAKVYQRAQFGGLPMSVGGGGG